MSKKTVHILGIAGSLRKASYNKSLLQTAQKIAPPSMEIELYSALGQIPLYNEDVREQGFPPVVETLREKIKMADGLLFVTPEYNYSIPGVLKNAIDWASRPPAQPFNEKPICIIGASPSLLGAARAQYDLRRCFIFLNGYILNVPEIFVNEAHKKFDNTGVLTDEGTKDILQKTLVAFETWIRKLA